MKKIKLTLVAIGAVREIEAEGHVPLLRTLEVEGFFPELVTLSRLGEETRELDLLQSPLEQGLADGDKLILSYSIRAGAGVLPLNALYRHTHELKELLYWPLRGMSAIVLYTPADTTFATFLERYLLSEIVHMSDTCVLFVPRGDVFKTNHEEFLAWWESEYKELDFIRALSRIHNPFYCTKPEEIYKLVRRLGLSGDVLPALVFFDEHPTQNVALRVDTSGSDALLLHMLRTIFAKADSVNRQFENRRLPKLQKQLKEFLTKTEKRGIDVPLTLFSIKILSPSFSFAESISKLISSD